MKKKKSNLLIINKLDFCSVRAKGLEPPRLTAPDPKSGAATNYATRALLMVSECKVRQKKQITKLLQLFFHFFQCFSGSFDDGIDSSLIIFRGDIDLDVGFDSEFDMIHL